MAGAWSNGTAPLKLASGESFGADSMLLLTDGTVLCHNSGTGTGKDYHGGSEWQLLTPGPDGSYKHGTWSHVPPMAHKRQYFASGVRADGTVFVIGGEYSDDYAHGHPADSDAPGEDTPLGEIFEMNTRRWVPLDKPTKFDWIQGDASCCVLSDGRVLLGAIDDSKTALYDPSGKGWTVAGITGGTGNTKKGRSNEETWTLLPDGTVLTIETYPISPRAAGKYVPGSDKWVSAGATPADMVDPDMYEIGPAILLPDGRVFAIGATGHTALYTPPDHDPEKAGSWSPGQDLRDSQGQLLTVNDGPACLLPNGKVLCCAGIRTKETHNGSVEYWSKNPIFFEYDPATNQCTQLDSELQQNLEYVYQVRLLLVPSGEVLCTCNQDRIFVYDPGGEPKDQWRPTITGAPKSLQPKHTYKITGTQLNGLSQAVSYGDDYTAATNYPLVRLDPAKPGAGHSYYCTTSGFGYGVATGMRPVSTMFAVPDSVAPGSYHLHVVANGIASKPWAVSVGAASTS